MSSKRKIFDILPPEEAQKMETMNEAAEAPRPRKTSRTRKGFAVLIVMFSLISVGIVYLIEARAEIEIKPKTEVSTFDVRVTVDGATTEKDMGRATIPGYMIESEDGVTEEFLPSGKIIKEAKARGTIRIYNAYSTISQTLVATTRFLSAQGQLFRIPTKVVVPGATYDKGKLVPSTVDVEVVADQSGEEYNIGPTTFSIPGLAGTPKYTSFYAKSFANMEGGFKKEVPQVTEQDIEEAQKVVSRKALEQSGIALNSKISQDLVLFSDAINQQVIEILPLAKAGQEDIEKFLVRAQAKSSALVFKKADLLDFTRLYLAVQDESLPGQSMYLDSLNLEYNPREIDLSHGKIVLDVKMAVRVYSDVDQEAFKRFLAGKDYTQIQQEMAAFYPDILEFKLTIFPFWTQKVPQDINRIQIKWGLD